MNEELKKAIADFLKAYFADQLKANIEKEERAFWDARFSVYQAEVGDAPAAASCADVDLVQRRARFGS